MLERGPPLFLRRTMCPLPAEIGNEDLEGKAPVLSIPFKTSLGRLVPAQPHRGRRKAYPNGGDIPGPSQSSTVLHWPRARQQPHASPLVVHLGRIDLERSPETPV